MYRKLRRTLSLGPSDFVFAAKAYALLIRSAWVIFIKRESAKSVNLWIDETRPAVVSDSKSSGFDYERASLWIKRVSRVPVPWARCYQRSVALTLWMTREGLKPELKLGVRKTDHGIDAHSWVEYEGRVINDSPNVREVFGSFAATLPDAESSGKRPTG